MKKTRYRILFPRPDGKSRPNITHWIFAADQKHKPINYGCAHFAHFTDGRWIEGYQIHREF